jgi:competence protein ComEA
MSRDQQGIVLFLSLLLSFFFLLTLPSSSWKEIPGIAPEEKAPGPQAGEGRILIEMDGSVNQRGMVQIEEGGTVLDAVAKAGGVKEEMAVSPENLALKLEKSSRVRIAPDSEGKGRVSVEPLDPPKLKVLSIPVPINTATAEELDILPGIGPKTAQAIIDDRDSRGKFAAAEDLLRVPGIGPKKLAALRPHISLK